MKIYNVGASDNVISGNNLHQIIMKVPADRCLQAKVKIYIVVCDDIVTF